MHDIKKFDHYTDIEIIHEILTGKSQLYELLIQRNNPFLYKVGRSYGYNHHDTEDLMQETYINAYVNLSKFEKRSTFKTWIIKIMFNNCYQKKQKHSYQKETLPENNNYERCSLTSSPDKHPWNGILNKELGHVLEQSLNQLPEDYRMVFALRELNGLSTIETAETLNISEANVKVRLNRTKALLRSQIQKIYSPDDIFEFNLIFCNRIVEAVISEINK